MAAQATGKAVLMGVVERGGVLVVAIKDATAVGMTATGLAEMAKAAVATANAGATAAAEAKASKIVIWIRSLPEPPRQIL